MKASYRAKALTLACALCLGITVSGCGAVADSGPQVLEGESSSLPDTTTQSAETTKAETTAAQTTASQTAAGTKPSETAPPATAAATAAATAPASGTAASAASPSENYDSNSYYDVVDRAIIPNSLGGVYIIHKVLAKQNVTVEGDYIAYDSSGSVLEKESDTITLTAGETNYFEYMFDNDVSANQYDVRALAQEDSFLTGTRDAVEMVDYSLQDDELYITVKQVAEDLSTFGLVKVLLYKGGKITGAEENFISSAEFLTGVGTTDVLTFWVYGEDFDTIEFIYEP